MALQVLAPLYPIKPVAPNPYDPSPHNLQQRLIFLEDGSVLPPTPPPPHSYNPCRRSKGRLRPAYPPNEGHYPDQEPVEVKPLTEEQLILCVPWVRGFVLKEKKWYQLAVDSVKDIIWNDSFTNLVLPHQEKDLFLAFAQSKINAPADESTMNVFDDFVDGKGKASSSRSVNAILLLNEADVFLEKCELNSLKRNKLVSIFLRLLEYYEGMMFLTINRVSTIDPAFESRIDVSINYPDLTPDLRFQIWAKFLFRSEQIRSGLDLSEKDLRPLAQLDMNGRQIKSAIKTAQLLAMSKGERLRITHQRAVVTLHRLAA